MNDATSYDFDASPAGRPGLWLVIVVLGGVLFFAAHDFQLSRYEGFTPWSDEDGVLEAGHNVAKGLALGLIGLLGAYLLLRRDGRPLRLTGWLPALMIFYLAWSAASVLWSPHPAMSGRWLAVLMFFVLGAAGFARHFRPRDLALAAMIIAGVYLLVGAAAEVALGTFRPWLADYRFAGTVHPNTQGAHLAVLCLASFCLARPPGRWQRWFWTVFAVGLVFLLLTKSRTSCAALAVALAAQWFLGAGPRARVLAVAAAGLLICATALAALSFGVGVDDELIGAAMLGRQEGSEALTGRVPIWTDLLGFVRERPLQGYGYESFWSGNRIEDVSEDLQWTLREAHNAYIDAALSVGLIGVATALAAVAIGLRRAGAAYRKTADPGLAFIFCVLVFGIVNACLESSMAGPGFITFIAGGGMMQLWALP